jgi:competence protein ComEC
MAGEAPSQPRRWLAEILGVSFAAQAATTPIVLLEFGRLSIVAPVVNLVVVPLVPPAMAAGALALVVGVLAGLGVPSIVAILVGLPAWALYAAMVAAVRAGASLPLASLELAAPWDMVGAAMSLALIVAVAKWADRWVASARRARIPVPGPAPRTGAGPTVVAGMAGRGRGSARRRSRAARIAALSLAGATIGLTLAVVYNPDGVARVVVLDVGQGDGILVEGGRGGRMVVDGGPDPGRLLIALDERLPPWDRRIDILVLTHPHEDHVAGLALLLQRYRVGRVYEPGMLGPGPGYRAWGELLTAGGPPRGRLATGDRLTLDGIDLRVLWPDASRVPERPPDGGTAINNVSIVLLGAVAGYRFLLAGDVEEGVDPELLARGLPRLDLLKVAHHGSRTATTRAFLEAVRPRVAIVSAGADNPYGHPAPSTLERLGELAHRTYRTDTDGAVEVAFDGGEVRVRTSGPRAAAGGLPAARPTLAVAGNSAPAIASFMCGLPAATSAVAPSPRAAALADPVAPRAAGAFKPPVAPEAPLPPRASLGPVEAEDAGDRRPTVGRLPASRGGRGTGLGYHRRDADLPGPGDRVAPRDGSPRLLLGRRRVRPRGGVRGVPRRPQPVPGRQAGALASGDRAHRTRPPPG